MFVKKARIETIIRLLAAEYGEQHWQPDHKPVDTLIQTILSQHTSDVNSHRTFRALVSAFPDWDSVAQADISAIAAAIRGGGLAEIKARRIKQALNEIERRHGRIELDFLGELPVEEARQWLKDLPGVGTKTANCVLLFSLGKPALPVDTHIYRVSKRLGLVEEKASVEQAHKLLEILVPAGDSYQFHVLMIEHGRRVCKAQHPRYLACVLGKICPSFGKLG